MIRSRLPVYFVTPDGASPELVLAAVRGGATMVQLRDKKAGDDALIELVRALKPELARRGVPLIVNDRLEVVLASGADGLHVGQSDGSPLALRRALGPGRLLGLSVEAMAHLGAIPAGVVDYLGVGPVRATATKPDHAAPLGLGGLARIAAASALPCVAIGGVGAGDARALKAAGAAGMAVVSAISAASDPEAAARALAGAWRNA
ncbi:thiamine phosphate synthase [Rhodovulum sulfidophilum]|uniref:thiamine phosphate synthase n=1 Tax=Rhodovulum sulfidophilum TaxID=35806 RepID=UPI001389F523|nr:thiamine phosphate synthase [Rhodovulum sulfidophilum]MBK5923933.1 thiamine-phosphate diphosphorylase [Rhodovulum sulfidophilum]MBL3566013.1 thiamine phosphate synthase [Rhodovulum sulfidophilum]MBL3596032.1 thiamine phosphate synthase [Rhodovulum sulfidophilum]MCE8439747.1 thiamine phosphate synthase [Rhodovulum sulfidophilum]MCE8470009.1 thiamine phosphate synthase [Rhodovulum sulfidophilum]